MTSSPPELHIVCEKTFHTFFFLIVSLQKTMSQMNNVEYSNIVV